MNNDSSSRIAAHLKSWLSAAAPGAKLPSTRSLVAEYQASPVTVQKALQTLAAQGLIESRPGVGTFVRAVRMARPSDYGWQTAALRSPLAALPPASSTMRDVPLGAITFHAGYPARELLPERLVRAG